MAIARVQKAGAQSSANVASQAFTLPQAPTLGNLVLVGANSDATLTGPTGFLLAASSISGQGLYLWYRVAQSGDSATAIVVPSVTDSVAGGILEYSGIVTVSPLDQTASGTASAGSSSISTGATSSTAQANELVVVCAGPHAGAGTFSLTSWTGGYTTQISEGAGLGTIGTTVVGCFIGDLTASTIGSYGSTAVYSPNGDAGALVATFKGVTGGPTTETDVRKVGRTVAWRKSSGMWIPAKMTAIGSGTTCTVKGADGSSYTGPKRVAHSDVNVWDESAR